MLVFDDGDDGVISAHIAAAGEVLDALAKTSAAHTRKQLGEAASAFERASRSHVRAARGHDRALRQAARDLVHGGPALGRGEDGATTAMLIDMAFFLVTAAAAWHGKKEHAQQAAAALQAAEHLRAAYQAAAGHPMAILHQRGRLLPPRSSGGMPPSCAEQYRSSPSRSWPRGLAGARLDPCRRRGGWARSR